MHGPLQGLRHASILRESLAGLTLLAFGRIGVVGTTVAVVFGLDDGALRAEHVDGATSPLVGIISVEKAIQVWV
jgi:hypothetical protein